jgi:3',5'-cyclic AMP phosphodiesterase CpdA
MMDSLYFVHISDTHLGPTAVYKDLHGVSPYPCAERLVEIINELPVTLFMHYPVWPLNSEWMDGNMLVENGRVFHNLLLPAKERLRGVFHGHIHQPMQTVRDGILYCSAASAYSQLAAWPGDEMVQHDFDHDPGYGFVHLLPGQMIVHQHTFPRPADEFTGTMHF